MASRIKAKPFVLSQHDYLFGATHGAKLFFHMLSNRTLGKFTLRTATAVIGVSSAAIRFAVELGAFAGNTCVIPNSVDTGFFCPIKSDLLKRKWDINGQVILFVGRLSVQKGLEVLLNAFARIRSEFPRANLVIVGRGPEEAHLKAMASELKLNGVTFLGLQPWSTMREIYPACELLVLPSFYEPFGNVVLEAMACGLPVIGTKIAGMADIISHGETGYHTPPGDVDRLSHYMRILLADSALRSKMSKAARNVAEGKFDDMIIARSVERLYYRCVERSQNWTNIGH